MANQQAMEWATRLNDLLEKCDTAKPDPKDVQAFRRELEATPTVWKNAGDLIEQSYHSLARRAIANGATTESLAVGWGQMKRDLGWDTSPLLEQMLIQHVLLCWLRMGILELKYTQALHPGSGTVSWEMCHNYDKHLEAAHRRYQRACITLARVRHLGRPGPVQVNIGRQQVNQVMTGTVAGA